MSKELNEYTITCKDCGEEIIFKSNQPSGMQEPLICSCYRDINAIIPEARNAEALRFTRLFTISATFWTGSISIPSLTMFLLDSGNTTHLNRGNMSAGKDINLI